MHQILTYTIGDVLLELGRVTRSDLDRAVEVQRQTGQKLDRILIDLGTVSEEDLRLAYGKLLQIPIWEKKKDERYPLVENMPKVFLVANRILPLKLHNGMLDVALADPMDSLLIETIALATNKQIQVFAGCEKDITAAIETLYEGELKEGEVATSSIEVMEDVEHLRDMASEAPVIRLVNSALTKAIEIGASDVHLEIFERNARLRYRVDGVLRELTPPPREMYNAIISRIKIMAKLNIAEKRLPQDGRIRMKVAGKDVDLRVSIIPMSHGEGVVLRILDRSAVMLDLEKLGFSREFLKNFRRMVNKPEGMLLVTGPTGSGKTTTLYAVLKEMISPDIKIITVEDPVEYSMEGVNQIQVAIQGKTGHAPDTFALRNLLDQGKRHHQAGQLAEAERSYQLALNMAPGHPETLQLLGLLAYRVGNFDQAIDLITQALDAAPSAPLYWFNLGVVTQRAGRKDEAVRAYEQALTLNPKYVEALINLGNVFKDLQRLDDAVQTYRKALALNPSHADTHNNLGVALKEQNALRDAIAAYREAIRLKPTHFEAWNNLGLALMETGPIEEAIASFEKALTIVPDSPKAFYNLGVASIWTGEQDRALALLTRIATTKHDHGRPVTETSLFRSRAKHDAEQARYLIERGLLDPSHQRYVEALDRLTITLAAQYPTKNRCPIEASALTPIAPSFNQFLYRAPCERLAEGALNPELDVPAIESRYLDARPEVTFIDQLLRPEALARLRRFCLESTIWKKDYDNGYLGAFLGDGFASPLLLQIAEELRLTFPGIFKQHHLTQAWAFKQDSARRGLSLHADAAAVNVNFWITPDEANVNPEKGGLIVYDKEAPADWNFAAYNSEQNKPKILEWLTQAGAQTIRVPYRANRAIVFNSDLFHETDEITFRDDYASRRINITLLYGYRHQL